jgi:hypothetical protein
LFPCCLYLMPELRWFDYEDFKQPGTEPVKSLWQNA